jgi:hypothetical protein
MQPDFDEQNKVLALDYGSQIFRRATVPAYW